MSSRTESARAAPGDAVPGFVRFSGGALFLGGVLVALVNLILSPLLPADEGSVAVYTSAVVMIRLPLAAMAVALVTLGCVGVYLAQAHRLRFGGLAFLLAGAGGLMVFAAECVQFTLVRDVAFAAPETLEQLESANALGRYDVGFGVAVGSWTLGWLIVAIVTLRAGILNRRGPIALIAGLVLLPVLGGLLGIWGAVVGNLVFGAGFALLGLDVRRASERKRAPARP